MADSEVQLPADGAGKEVRTITTLVPLKTQDQGLDTVHQQVVVEADKEGDVEDAIGVAETLKLILLELQGITEILGRMAFEEERVGQSFEGTDDEPDAGMTDIGES